MLHGIKSIVQSQEMFTTERIDKYQQKADAFFFKWLTLNGVEGMTNYTHIIVCHMRSFLLIYGNLYKYSQQGWEHHNKRLLGIYHQHTQKGGYGAKADEKGHIFPLFANKCCCWMWKTAYGRIFLKKKTTKCLCAQVIINIIKYFTMCYSYCC